MTNIVESVIAVLVLSVAAFAAAANSPAPNLPEKINLSYEITSGGGVVGVAEQTVTRDGAEYAITNQMTPKGLLALFNKDAIEQSSRGSITANGLRPEEYRDRRGGKAPTVATFNWDAASLNLLRQGRETRLPLEKNTLDRLSFPFSFAFSQTPDKKLSIAMTDGKRIKTYDYVLAGREKLKTPIGELQTLHLIKQRENDDDSRTELWLALDHHLLPVRLLVAEDGKPALDQVITKIRY
ncbi:MAG: DUF3108 domain-containing protein [Burkholderiales bacterium]|nr:DUF3108 domain-containing protein [Burkholderiales bacterium]MDQ3196566.1 DUF3108 domain-containing protein [Pseudomonadota bacterium]